MSKATKNGSQYTSRGRRYSPAEKAQIVADARTMGVASAAEKHRSSKWTIYDWLKKQVAEQVQPADEPQRDEQDAVILAAHHMGVLGPFIPALTQLLMRV